MTSPLLVPVEIGGVVLSINPAAIESIRAAGSDGVIRTVSGIEYRVRAVAATPEIWAKFVAGLGVRATPKGAA